MKILTVGIIVLFTFQAYAADVATWRSPIKTKKDVSNLNDYSQKIWQWNADIPGLAKYCKRSPTDNNIIQLMTQKEQDIYEDNLWIAQKAALLVRLNSAAFDWRNFDSPKEMRDERDAKIASANLLVAGNTAALGKIGW